jgi:hypothetical protein
MTVAICMPFYLQGNPNNPAYKRTFRHYASLGYPLHLCGSEGRLSREFCEEFLSDTVKYIEVQQDDFCILSRGDSHLRSKFNRSLATLEVYSPDWYCLAGADDIAPQCAFSRLEETPAKGVIMGGVGRNYPLFIAPEDGPAFRCELSYSVKLQPGINCFSRGSWQYFKRKPYHLNGCETGAEMAHVQQGKLLILPGYIVMLKGKHVLNTTEKIRSRHPCFDLNADEKQIVKQYT